MKIRKAAVGILLLMVSFTCVNAAEDEHTTTDENGNIVTDLPWNQEIEGKVYGSLIGKVKDDDKDDEDINISIEEPSETKPQKKPEMTRRPNIRKPNQSLYGITEEGTDKADTPLYKWEQHMEKLTIYPAMFALAKKEQKNIVMRIIDEDGKLRYRVKVLYKDFQNMKDQEIVFVFGAACSHKKSIYDSAGTMDIAYLLQCKQEHIPIPVYIGVGVPDEWDKEIGAYQYTFENNELVFLNKDLQIDEEHVVEVKMTPGKDHIFANQTLPPEGKNLKSWIAGVQGKNENIHQGMAIASTVMYACAGITMIAAMVLLIKRYSRKPGDNAKPRGNTGFKKRIEL